jgi:hypothetical protein
LADWSSATAPTPARVAGDGVEMVVEYGRRLAALVAGPEVGGGVGLVVRAGAGP